MRVSLRLVACALGASIFPLTGAAPASAADVSGCTAPNLNSPTLQHLIVSPVKDVPVPRYPKEETEAVEIANSGKALGYTRLRAAYVPCKSYQRDYPKERRSGINRYFFGKNAEKLLKLDVYLKPGDVRLEFPLTNMSRHSNKQGEDWATSVHNERILTPYFRADRGSIVTLEASVKSTRDYDATIGADVLDLISQASALLTPTTPLITEENKGRFNAAAGFVDKAVEGLLKVAIEEKALSDLQLYPGKDGAVLAVITVNLPMANNTFPNATFPNYALGQWIIYAEGLRQSVLGDVTNGVVKRSSTSPAAVLNFLVAERKTLREVLAGVKSVTSARDALVGAADAQNADKARALCRALAVEAETIGFSPADVGATMWAYLHDLALPEAKMKLAEPGCSGLERYPQT